MEFDQLQPEQQQQEPQCACYQLKGQMMAELFADVLHASILTKVVIFHPYQRILKSMVLKMKD